MSKKRKNYTSLVAKVGLGFDPVLDLIEQVNDTLSYDDLTAIPPFNLKKTTDKNYVVELSLPGAKKEAIKAQLDSDYLVVSAKVDDAYDPEGDDLYFHKGIFSGGKFEAKFLIAKNLQFKGANFEDSILSIELEDTNLPRATTLLPIGPFPVDTKEVKVEYNSAGEPQIVPVGEDVNTSVNAVPILVPEEPAPAPVEETPVVETPTAVVVEPTPVESAPPVVVNADSDSVPTTQVILPAELPPVVEVQLSDVAPAVETSSTAPQATILVGDATHEVSDNTSLEVIKTPEGQPDIVVSVPDTVAAQAEAKGIDVVADVKAAIESSTKAEDVTLPPVEDVVTPNIQAEPVVVADDKVEVTVPAELPPVVGLVKNEESEATVPAVSIDTNIGTDIPADSVLVPVVTQEGQSDVVVAVPPELHAELTNAGIDIPTAVSEAVKEVEPDVISTPVETTPVVVNAEDTTTPTVEVAVPTELPQVIEVKVSDVPATVDPASPEPQVSVELKDATTEIVSNDVVTDVIKTEEGKADVVVAVDADTHAELLDKGIDVLAAVKDAVAVAEPAAPELPIVSEEPKTTEVPVPTAETPVVVSVPENVPTVVEAVVEETPKNEPDKVVLKDAGENIPEDATVTPVVTQEGQPDIVVVTTPETDKKLEDLGVDVATDVQKAVVEAAPEVVASGETATETVTVNSESKTEPTVEVSVPTVVPQIVEVGLSDVADKVSTTSAEPQATIELKDATHEVSDNVDLSLVKTEEGKADIVVAVPADVAKVADEKGIDITAAVEEAIKSDAVTLPDAPTAPADTTETHVEVTPPETPAAESVTVSVPDTVTPVMEASVAVQDDLGKVVTLTPADGDVPADSTLVPVVTPEGQPDIVVAVPEEVKNLVAEQNVDLGPALETAVKEADVTVSSEVVKSPDATLQPVQDAVPGLVDAPVSDGGTSTTTEQAPANSEQAPENLIAEQPKE